jgi:hypothetical protein
VTSHPECGGQTRNTKNERRDTSTNEDRLNKSVERSTAMASTAGTRATPCPPARPPGLRTTAMAVAR